MNASPKRRSNSQNDIPVLKPVRQVNIRHPLEIEFTKDDPDRHTRLLELTHGIYIMEEWWRMHNITVHYHIVDFNQYFLDVLPELSEHVLQMHKIIAPQQKIDGKQLIFGLGATQLLHAAYYAYCVMHAKSNKENRHFLNAAPLYFTHQTPGYLDPREVLLSFNEFNSKWINFADHKKVGDENLVEVITAPNNPDSRMLKRETNSAYYINDRVNLWPFFMTASLDAFTEETLANDQISIFSLPKLLSFSGSRVGYAFVNDPKIVEYMKYFIMIETHGLAGDGQIRCLTGLRYLIENNKINEYFDWLFQQFKSRWQQVERVMAKSGMKLLNHEGAGIWIKTPEKAKDYLYKKYLLTATYGPEYGASEYYARLNLQCTTNEFEELIHRLSTK